MSTRITNAMMTTNYLSDMQTNLNSMSTTQSQMSSGQKIQRGSDDPSGAIKVMRLNSELSANDQYGENISDTSNWLDTTDTALSEAGNVLARIRTLMVKAGNGSYEDNEISTIKEEVVSSTSQLAQELNTSFDGTYVFGGTKGTSKPITVDTTTGTLSYADKDGTAIATAALATSDDYKQISSPLTVEISEGVKVNYNVTASELLNFHDSDLGVDIDTNYELSKIISDLTAAAKSESTDATEAAAAVTAKSNLAGTDLEKLDAIIENFLAARAKVGTTQNRMESASTSNEDQDYNMTGVLSDTQDVDYTEASVQYSTAQTIYKAALQVSSKIMENTLLDYL